MEGGNQAGGAGGVGRGVGVRGRVIRRTWWEEEESHGEGWMGRMRSS